MDWGFFLVWICEIVTDISPIVSILGLVISIVGLIYSYKSWENTKNIYDAFNTEKLKDKYRVKHYEFVSRLESALHKLCNKERDYNIIFDVYQTCMDIYALNDGWSPFNQNQIYKFIRFLDSLPNDKEISEKKWLMVQKGVSDALAILERIGSLEKIDEPNDNSTSETNCV